MVTRLVRDHLHLQSNCDSLGCPGTPRIASKYSKYHFVNSQSLSGARKARSELRPRRTAASRLADLPKRSPRR